jgi:hypothetical protein
MVLKEQEATLHRQVLNRQVHKRFTRPCHTVKTACMRILLNLRTAPSLELITRLRGVVVYLIIRYRARHLPGLHKYHQEIRGQRPRETCTRPLQAAHTFIQEVQSVEELRADYLSTTSRKVIQHAFNDLKNSLSKQGFQFVAPTKPPERLIQLQNCLRSNEAFHKSYYAIGPAAPACVNQPLSKRTLEQKQRNAFQILPR